MSAIRICTACQMGSHNSHVAGEHQRGLLGGWDCPCTGDCVAPDFSFVFGSKITSENTASDPVLKPEQQQILHGLHRAHLMSCSDPSDPTRHTTYGDAADLIESLLETIKTLAPETAADRRRTRADMTSPDDDVNTVRATAWIAEYEHYVHGVFATEEDADAYTQRRWGAHPPRGWEVVAREVGKGAFDPREEKTERAYVSRPTKDEIIARLRDALDERFEDGEFVIKYVLATRPDLRDRLAAWIDRVGN